MTSNGGLPSESAAPSSGCTRAASLANLDHTACRQRRRLEAPGRARQQKVEEGHLG